MTKIKEQHFSKFMVFWKKVVALSKFERPGTQILKQILNVEAMPDQVCCLNF